MHKLIPEIVVKHRLHLLLAKRGECLRQCRSGPRWSNDRDEYYIALLDTDQVIKQGLDLDELARQEGVIGTGDRIATD